MDREVELKLEIAASAVDEVGRQPWLKEVSNGAPKCEKLVTVYYDTAKSKLRENGLTLRVRHAGDNRVQTIKVDKKGKRGAFGRDEWEEKIERDTPNLKFADGTALESLATNKLQRKLKPIFETVVERTTFPIRAGDTDLEVAVDRGFIQADGRHEPISEIEIELKNGELNGIAVIVDRLARSVPISYAARSKAERGYALSADHSSKACSCHNDRPCYRGIDCGRISGGCIVVSRPCRSQRQGCP